jgi:hypothetical protein
MGRMRKRARRRKQAVDIDAAFWTQPTFSAVRRGVGREEHASYVFLGINDDIIELGKIQEIATATGAQSPCQFATISPGTRDARIRAVQVNFQLIFFCGSVLFVL